MVRSFFAWGGPQPRRLVAERVYLRYPSKRDWREWARLRAANRDFLAPWEPTWPADALERQAFRRRLRRQLDEISADRAYPFFIFRRDDDALVGGVTLANIRRGVSQSGTVGYWIGAEYAGRGYMTEALSALLTFAFDTLRLHRVEAICIPENQRSRNLLERIGFQQEGYARGVLRIEGAWRDHIAYAILRDDLAAPDFQSCLRQAYGQPTRS